jgi:hypothetical protein
MNEDERLANDRKATLEEIESEVAAPFAREQSVAELRLKAQLVDSIIREARSSGDPRWKDALALHEAINERLLVALARERAARCESDLPAQQVSLKTASLLPKPASMNRSKEGSDGAR